MLALLAFTPLAGALAGRAATEADLRAADAIVVLGSGVMPEGELADGSLRRTVHGVRLFHRGLAPRLVLLGPPYRGVVEAEIRAAYDSAMAAGKYVHVDGRKHYATTNAGEYWAEGVQWWFFSNYGECFAGDVKVETPEEFAAYDPALNELIGRVFTTHRIPMDVFHGKRIRPVKCGS